VLGGVVALGGKLLVGLGGKSGFHELLEGFNTDVDGSVVVLLNISTRDMLPFLLPDHLIWTLDITIPLGILVLVIVPRRYVLLYL
jgi:hypothetical protein